MAQLSYLTFLADDVAALAQFYIDALGLAEVAESRDHRYREVRAGGCMIGFAEAAARSALNLPDDETHGIRSLATFAVGAPEALPAAIAQAEAAGGELLREAIDTPFGQRQAVLRDPEGNVFRLSAGLNAAHGSAE